MQIGVIGWWSYDNQGDLAMLSALRAGLAPHRVVPLDVGFAAHPDALYRLNRLDYVILGGGTLIPRKPGPPFDTFDSWQNWLECPLGVAGLGVDPLIESYRPAVNALIDHARFFFVRDHASFQLLGRPEVQIAPDLTFAYPLQVERAGWGERKRPLCGINLRKSAQFDPHPWLEVIAHLPIEIRGIPLSSFESFDESALLRQLDPGCATAYAPDLYAGLDLMIGAAFHSAVFAVQAAVPIIAIAYAPKVRHFMEEIGLGQYVLSADEWGKLPELVDEVLAARAHLQQRLETIREGLQRKAHHMFQTVGQEIAQSGQRHKQFDASVTAIVIGSGDWRKDERTLTSCLAQTHENLEVLFSPAEESSQELPAIAADRVTVTDARSGYAGRLQCALTKAQGEYVTWLDSGDWLAEDALDCLVSRLEQDPGCDVLYSDYWLLSEANMPVETHYVPEAGKLYRRDVVGPCFLVRKRVLSAVNGFPPDSPLPTYSQWLELSSAYRFTAFHAPLMYSARQPRAPHVIVRERAARRVWRKNLPAWRRALWRVIDSDFGERVVIQPVARLNRLLRSVIHGRR